MKIALFLAGCAGVLVVIALGSFFAPTAASPPAPFAAPAMAPAPIRSEVVGAGSCAARACHGGPEPIAAPTYGLRPVRRTEHTTWILEDRHSRAYQSLRSRRSVDMIDRLGWKAPAHREARCLACHATPTRGLAGREAEEIRQEGVGCESCHGPASRWISEHTTVAWGTNRRAGWDGRDFGMTPIDHLGVRAQNCAGCHVGAPADPAGGYPIPRDVNHDMIAAGHPRLAFELSSFLDRMPRHWAEREPQAGTWAVGQVATARAALDLLADRADRAKVHPDDTPWPEFSEYSCFECHFQLDGKPGWRAKNRAPGELGQPTWGSWSTPMLAELARPEARAGLPPIESSLSEIRQAMRLPAPAPDAASAPARRASVALAAWLRGAEGRPFSRDSLSTTLGSPRDHAQNRAFSGWDHAAQYYLALRTLNLGDGGMAPPLDRALEVELRDLRHRLLFRRGYDSPRGFTPDVTPAGQ